MFNICPVCGEYAEEKVIDPEGPFAICPHCGYAQRFRRLPLFLLTGASGAGKSTVGLALMSSQEACVVMESDILWRPEFASPDDGYAAYRNLWLRVAKNISQAGRPVVLVGSAVPGQFEACPERRYFSTLHYLALVATDDELARRLRGRPAWRQSATPAFLAEMLRFNRWLREHAATTTPPMMLIDTTNLTVAESLAQTQAWLAAFLS